jgi:phosphatidylglycerol---prolipoprotein diacylglyceryl transferase
MRPELFRIGPVGVPTHDLFVLLGVLVAAVVYFHEARRRGIVDERLTWIAIGALLSGAVGAKLSVAWRYLAAPEAASLAVVWLYGRSILGGLVGAYVGVLITKRIVGYRRHTGDLFAPAVALGMAVGRWGCFLTEQIGTPTSLPWGIAVAQEVGAGIPNCPHCAAGVPLHPSFLYEIVFHATMFGVLLWLRPRVHVEGELLKIYLIAYAVFRFLVEFVRGNEVLWADLTGPQLFLVPTTGLLIIYFVRQWTAGAYGTRPVVAAGLGRKELT